MRLFASKEASQRDWNSCSVRANRVVINLASRTSVRVQHRESIGAAKPEYQCWGLIGPAVKREFSLTVYSLAMRSTLKTRSFASLLCLLAGLAWSSQALAFRCGTKLVVEGMHRSEVSARCGEATTETVRYTTGQPVVLIDRSRPRRYRRNPNGLWTTTGFGPVVQEIVIHEWTYNFGPRRLMRLLRFENDRLVRIEELGHGYR